MYLVDIFSHVIENLENIERHANHRPGYYKDNVSPLIHGLFSRWFSQIRTAMKVVSFAEKCERLLGIFSPT